MKHTRHDGGREGEVQHTRHEGGREGGKEGGREGGREGGKEGRREGGREGERERGIILLYEKELVLQRPGRLEENHSRPGEEAPEHRQYRHRYVAVCCPYHN